MNTSHHDVTATRSQPVLGFSAVQASHVGKVCKHNEDCSAWLPELGLAVVADGVGGYCAGEVASAIATSQIVNTLYNQWLTAGGRWPEALYSSLTAAIEVANSAIINVAKADTGCQGMATTAVVAVFQDQSLWIAHIGDSRLYRWRQSTLTRLTRDHTLQQRLIDQGFCTPAEAVTAVGSHIITRALGTEVTARVETSCHDIQAGDHYLLCSDGLHDMLEDHEIAQVLASTVGVHNSAYRLLDQANLAGGRDNITVVLVAS